MTASDRRSRPATVSTRAHQHDMGTVDDKGRPVLARKQEFYQGNLPHPEHLARFEEILPGTAERILQMAENEQRAAHRAREKDQEFRDKLVDATSAENKRKHYIALAALVLCLAASGVLAASGAVVAAGIVGGTTVIGVIASFLGGQSKEAKEGKKAEGEQKQMQSGQASAKGQKHKR